MRHVELVECPSKAGWLEYLFACFNRLPPLSPFSITVPTHTDGSEASLDKTEKLLLEYIDGLVSPGVQPIHDGRVERAYAFVDGKALLAYSQEGSSIVFRSYSLPVGTLMVSGRPRFCNGPAGTSKFKLPSLTEHQDPDTAVGVGVGDGVGVGVGQGDDRAAGGDRSRRKPKKPNKEGTPAEWLGFMSGLSAVETLGWGGTLKLTTETLKPLQITEPFPVEDHGVEHKQLCLQVAPWSTDALKLIKKHLPPIVNAIHPQRNHGVLNLGVHDASRLPVGVCLYNLDETASLLHTALDQWVRTSFMPPLLEQSSVELCIHQVRTASSQPYTVASALRFPTHEICEAFLRKHEVHDRWGGDMWSCLEWAAVEATTMRDISVQLHEAKRAAEDEDDVDAQSALEEVDRINWEQRQHCVWLVAWGHTAEVWTDHTMGKLPDQVVAPLLDDAFRVEDGVWRTGDQDTEIRLTTVPRAVVSVRVSGLAPDMHHRFLKRGAVTAYRFADPEHEGCPIKRMSIVEMWLRCRDPPISLRVAHRLSSNAYSRIVVSTGKLMRATMARLAAAMEAPMVHAGEAHDNDAESDTDTNTDTDEGWNFEAAQRTADTRLPTAEALASAIARQQTHLVLIVDVPPRLRMSATREWLKAVRIACAAAKVPVTMVVVAAELTGGCAYFHPKGLPHMLDVVHPVSVLEWLAADEDVGVEAASAWEEATVVPPRSPPGAVDGALAAAFVCDGRRHCESLSVCRLPVILESYREAIETCTALLSRRRFVHVRVGGLHASCGVSSFLAALQSLLPTSIERTTAVFSQRTLEELVKGSPDAFWGAVSSPSVVMIVDGSLSDEVVPILQRSCPHTVRALLVSTTRQVDADIIVSPFLTGADAELLVQALSDAVHAAPGLFHENALHALTQTLQSSQAPATRWDTHLLSFTVAATYGCASLLRFVKGALPRKPKKPVRIGLAAMSLGCIVGRHCKVGNPKLVDKWHRLVSWSADDGGNWVATMHPVIAAIVWHLLVASNDIATTATKALVTLYRWSIGGGFLVDDDDEDDDDEDSDDADSPTELMQRLLTRRSASEFGFLVSMLWIVHDADPDRVWKALEGILKDVVKRTPEVDWPTVDAHLTLLRSRLDREKQVKYAKKALEKADMLAQNGQNPKLHVFQAYLGQLLCQQKKTRDDGLHYLLQAYSVGEEMKETRNNIIRALVARHRGNAGAVPSSDTTIWHTLGVTDFVPLYRMNDTQLQNHLRNDRPPRAGTEEVVDFLLLAQLAVQGPRTQGDL